MAPILVSHLLLKRQKDKLILEASENWRFCTKAGSWRLHLPKSLNNWSLLFDLHVLPSWMVGITEAQYLPSQCLTGFVLYAFLGNLSLCFSTSRKHTVRRGETKPMVAMWWFQHSHRILEWFRLEGTFKGHHSSTGVMSERHTGEAPALLGPCSVSLCLVWEEFF